MKLLAKVKVLPGASTDNKEKMASFELNKIIINVQLLRDIFSTHYLEYFEDGRVVHPYNIANYMVNKLPDNQVRKSLILYTKKLCVENAEIKNGMCLVVPYNFATTSSKKQRTKILKNLLPLGLDVNLKTIDIQYGKAVEQPLKHFIWVPNDEY